MKNNEYNHNKVNNEGPSSLSEFTLAQPTESHFYRDNLSHKDELNAKKTVNDSVEESAVINKNNKKRIDYKKMKEGPTHLASSAGHAVVAASTVSVAVVAVVIGVSVVPTEELKEQITFTDSEIGTDSISFSFALPGQLLGYYQEDDPTGAGQVVEQSVELYATVYNEEYKDNQLIVEMSEYELDPSFMEAYGYFDGLTPDTDYVLSIYTETTTWDETQESSTVVDELARRTFRTQAISADVTYYHVTYAESDDYRIEGLLNQYEAYDEVTFWVTILNSQKEIDYVLINRKILEPVDEMYLFTMPEEDVTIDVILKNANLIDFTSFEVSYDHVSIQYTFDPSIVRAHRAGAAELSMSAELLKNGEVVDETTVGYEPMDGTLYTCYIDFYGLSDSTDYEVRAYLDKSEEEKVLLGSTTFSTKTPDPIVFEVVESYNYVSYSFDVTNETIEFDPDYPSQSLNIRASISDGEQFYQEVLLKEYEQKDASSLTVYGAFEDLQPETEYTITIAYITQSLVVTLGQTTFTTSAKPYGFTGITFSEKASYYNHTFTATLDYFDDDNNPNYSSFELTLRDITGRDLETFELEATTNIQTLTVSSTESGDGPIYSYGIEEIYSYELTVYSLSDSDTITLDSGEVSFTDSDISNFNGFGNDEFIVSAMEGMAIMPIKLDYIDEGHQWHDFVINLKFADSQGVTGESTVSYYGRPNPTTDWQYIYLDPVTEGTTIDMFLDETATLTVTVNEEDVVFEQDVLISSSTEWEFYDMGLYDLTLSEQYTDLTAYFIYNTYNEWDQCEVTVTFQDTSNQEEFIYRFNLMGMYPSKEYSFSMFAILEAPQGYEFATYQNLIDVYSGKTFNVYFEIKLSNSESGESSTEQPRLIHEGVSFTFE